MPSKYATKKPKPLDDSFGRDYVRMWSALRGIAECSTLCPHCKEKAEECLMNRYDEKRKKINE